MRVIGIDPGLQRTGWGVVDVEGTRIRHVANGVCRSAGADLAARLCSLHAGLTAVMRAFSPEAAAVEQTFVNKDAAGTLKLGQDLACDRRQWNRGADRTLVNMVLTSAVGSGRGCRGRKKHQGT